MGNHQQAFTLVELILVIIVLGIISSVALPRFFNTTDFDHRFFYEDLRAALDYGQKTAVSSGCAVRIELNSTGYELYTNTTANCGSPATWTTQILHPSDNDHFTGSLPTSLGYTTPAVLPDYYIFTAEGKITDNAGSQIGNESIVLSDSNSITLYGSTGFIQ